MKKTLLTLVLAFCVLAGQGQTSTTASGVNTTELNSKWAQFTQLAEKKQYKQAIDEGVRVSILFTENRQYKEAFATCRQMDALIYTNEQETKKANYPLRYQVTKERLRMYTRLKNAEQCKKQLNQLHTYADQIKSDSLSEDLLFTEANYYQTFGMPDKSLACYKELFRKRSKGKDEKSIEQCYKDMLSYAEQNNNAPLAGAMRKLYTSWQDSIQTVKAAQKLTTLQQKYDENRQLLQEKEDKISTNLFIIIAQIEPTLNTMEEATEVFSAKILQKNIEALKKLMTDIQTYVTLEETREEHYPLKDMNINALCETIMEKAKANFKPEVEAVLNVPRVNIKTNAEALERILLYLLRNAALHTDNGKITLEFKKRSAHTGQFIITDTGTGIPTEIKGKLFKPFAEIHDLTQGNGLGLPTCSLIAYKLNGTLHLDNEYKKGTRFVLELHDK